MKHRSMTTALLLALLISGACTWLLSRKMAVHAATERPDAKYVAPSRPLHAGEVLKPDNMELVSWPAANPIHSAATRIADLTGRVVLYPIEKGEPIIEPEMAVAGSGLGLAGKIPDGMRALALKSDEVVGVAGFLIPGSHLDVLVTYRAEQAPEPLTATVLQDSVVLAVGQQIDPDPAGKPAAVTVVTLLLSPTEAERAVLASNQGKIHFILRNGADKTRTQDEPVYLSQLSGGPRLTIQGAKQPQTATAPHPLQKILTAAREPMIETILGDGKESPKQDAGAKQ